MFDSVRTRLTLWHTVTLAFVLIAFSLGVYLLAASQLHRRLDAGVRTPSMARKWSFASLRVA